MLYMATFTINIPPMLAYIPYMDPMGSCSKQNYSTKKTSWMELHKHLATILEKVSNKKNGWYNSPSCWLRVISGWFRPKSTRLSTTQIPLCHIMPYYARTMPPLPPYYPIKHSPSLSVARFSLLMFDNVNPR